MCEYCVVFHLAVMTVGS